MGVPGLFVWFLKKFGDKIKKSFINTNIDIFYIDANSLFHLCSNKIIEKYSNIDISSDILESHIIDSIIYTLDLYINLIKPKLYTFISVDGIVPFGKIKQQRIRRFKSYHEKKIWNSSNISPGTLFMEKLNYKILDFIHNKNIIYSSFKDFGEGEHKIFNHISFFANRSFKHLIYGLDADLIFLSLISRSREIYLMREEQFFNNDISSNSLSFNYININDLRININNLISKKQNNYKISHNYKPTIFARMCDFVFFCFFIGNDFISGFTSLDITNGGIDTLIKIYCMTYASIGNLIVKGKINDPAFVYFFDKLNDLELENLCKLKSKHSIPPIIVDDHIFSLLKYFDTKNQNNFLHSLFINHYNDYCFGNSDISFVCENYMKNIFWTLHYYFQYSFVFDDILDNSFFFEFNFAPLLSDFLYFINGFYLLHKISIKNSISSPPSSSPPSLSFSFDNFSLSTANHILSSHIVPPLKSISFSEQLLIILPKPLHSLIHSLPIHPSHDIYSKYHKYFISDFNFDLIFTNKLFKSNTSIPMISFDLIKKISHDLSTPS